MRTCGSMRLIQRKHGKSSLQGGGGGGTGSADTQWEVGNEASMFCCKILESRNDLVLNGSPLEGVSGPLL